VLTVIKNKTKKLFIPISIQNSPLSTNTDMLITLRAYLNNAEIFGLGPDFPMDENILAKRFSIVDIVLKNSK